MLQPEPILAILSFCYFVLIFSVGLLVGSFLNVVADRGVNGESILIGRSHCDECKKSLGLKNLIPLFSFIFQRGKCSWCGTKLSVVYPISELICGLLFVLAFYMAGFFGANVEKFSLVLVLYYLAIFSVYLVIFLSDLKYQLIADRMVYLGISLVLVFNVILRYLNVASIQARLADNEFGAYMLKAGYLNLTISRSMQDFAYTLLSAIALSLMFWLLVRFTNGKGMGEGDVMLALLIGLFNGFPLNIIAIFLGFFIGAVVGVSLVLSGEKKMKSEIAFGPFMVLGSFIALVWGRQLLDWYLSLSFRL